MQYDSQESLGRNSVVKVPKLRLADVARPVDEGAVASSISPDGCHDEESDCSSEASAETTVVGSDASGLASFRSSAMSPRDDFEAIHAHCTRRWREIADMRGQMALCKMLLGQPSSGIGFAGVGKAQSCRDNSSLHSSLQRPKSSACCDASHRIVASTTSARHRRPNGQLAEIKAKLELCKQLLASPRFPAASCTQGPQGQSAALKRNAGQACTGRVAPVAHREVADLLVDLEHQRAESQALREELELAMVDKLQLSAVIIRRRAFSARGLEGAPLHQHALDDTTAWRRHSDGSVHPVPVAAMMAASAVAGGAAAVALMRLLASPR
mmetsp:Transcript_4368/g.10555  ORF Transcript_4368/g.10555 Transcript_4368/m.10555 type:complete len:326 (-) Transcript_4368:228-1205(-)|eukprot:CAMPEP_0115198084 /NCGR_PEP_ID=MMETSP0270-20121206/15923_1 /TAXON_ID=71861 /ORGANISM="Scrippsiella trochoidea, Strain CCMP3099" /LENGTH=325 /DNA_ID=CAMNT_0002611445 /DNA_START=64 /DNA_END=1041 /DNA_ORIENTATION=+